MSIYTNLIPRLLGIFVVVAVLFVTGSVQAHESTASAVQTGKATWYGPKFHGRKTASGERFDMHDLTAAHPSLPLGTVAKVTNLANGRSVQVEINDRGPAKRIQRRGIVIDLSLGAAKKLGFVKKGKTAVKIDILQLGKGRGT